MGVVQKIELEANALVPRKRHENNTIMIDLSGQQAGHVKILQMQQEIIKASEGKLKIEEI